MGGGLGKYETWDADGEFEIRDKVRSNSQSDDYDYDVDVEVDVDVDNESLKKYCRSLHIYIISQSLPRVQCPCTSTSVPSTLYLFSMYLVPSAGNFAVIGASDRKSGTRQEIRLNQAN